MKNAYEKTIANCIVPVYVDICVVFSIAAPTVNVIIIIIIIVIGIVVIVRITSGWHAK